MCIYSYLLQKYNICSDNQLLMKSFFTCCIKTRNQVKDIPVHQERVFLLRQPIHKTKDIITGQ